MSQELYAKAMISHDIDPSGPSYEDFCIGPLGAAVFQCARGFDKLSPADEGSPVRLLVLPASGRFPLIVFYAIQVASPSAGEAPYVEILDYSVDGPAPTI
ncbi:MAG: hypothetical protein AAGD35_10385 [Actinomycetota bacterium]